MESEERRVVAEEATEVATRIPNIPAWVRTAVAAYAAKVGNENWPSELGDLAKFAQKMRRTEETLAPAHGTDRGTLRWLAIAWGKQNGHVPQELNRADKHGGEIPYWASGMIWDLQGDKPAPA